MKESRIVVCGLVVLIALVIAACTPNVPSESTGTTPAGSVPKPAAATESASSVAGSAKEAWEEKWGAVLEAAKREGKVVVYGAPAAEVRSAMIQSFKAKYGIPLEYISISGPESAAKIQAERRARLYLVDVLLGASAPGQNILKPDGAFDPLEPALILPEVTDKKNWWEGELPWVDADHYRLAFSIYVSVPLVINTQMVKPEEIKSWRDLLNPKWKGKITIVDPTKNNSGNVTIVSLAWKLMGMDYVRELAKQELVITSDRRMPVEWVARGKYPIVLAPYNEAVVEFIQAGAPLMEIVPAEGTHQTGGSGYLSLMNGAPHPNAARVFLNWLLTKETQTLYSKQMGVQSAREDVPTEHLTPLVIRRAGVPYFATWREDFLLTSEQRLKLGQEIFGPYLKK